MFRGHHAREFRPALQNIRHASLVHRSPVVENKRLDDMLSLVAQIQEGRDLKRSKHGPRLTGQTNSMFEIPDGSQSNRYQKRGRKPGRWTDFMNDPEVIAKKATSACSNGGG